MLQARKSKKPGRPRATRGRANSIDAYVGSRVRQRRTLLGLSQEKLADALNLTFQQVQKYERGSNRIGAGRLHQISGVLEVPISYFFEDMPRDVLTRTGQPAKGLAEDTEVYEADPMAKRETLELVRAYYRIVDPRVRKRVFEMVKAIGRSGR
jgi:transcriptional regulator with XRE-family HTH domain